MPKVAPSAGSAMPAAFHGHPGGWRNHEETAAVVAQNGANVLVAGSAVFKQPDYQKAISAIRESAQQAYPRAK